MKASKSPFILLVLFLSLSGITIAAGDKPKTFTQKIQAALSAPKQLKSHSEKVTVCFVVNGEGNVVEANAKTQNADIKRHLEKQFLGLNLCGLEPCVTNSITVNFITQ